jgi:hypothetical protein
MKGMLIQYHLVNLFPAISSKCGSHETISTLLFLQSVGIRKHCGPFLLAGAGLWNLLISHMIALAGTMNECVLLSKLLTTPGDGYPVTCR